MWISPDLVNWSEDRLLNVNRPNDSFSWVPAVHWDPSRGQYGITFSTAPTGAGRAMIMVAHTTDFVGVTEPAGFFGEGSDWIIDSHVVTNVDGMNYLYCRGFATQTTAGARSSLESVNFPGHHLRHANFDLVHAPREDTDLFRADATFHQEPGLAGPGWSSFRSRNHPSRHIRHVDGPLRPSEVTDAAARADATFHVGY